MGGHGGVSQKDYPQETFLGGQDCLVKEDSPVFLCLLEISTGCLNDAGDICRVTTIKMSLLGECKLLCVVT